MGMCLRLTAQDADSISMRPTFGVNYSGELQTDFKLAHMACLLQLHADIPVTRSLSFQFHSVSTLSSKRELEVLSLQGYSNIDTYGIDIPFAIAVAGFTWHIGERHTLFAGIRRTDEDYFCSDALGLFTNSSCGIFPTISWNFPIGTFPLAALGIHYAYDHDNLRLQASLYNGEGNCQFSGRESVLRFRPQSDGLFAVAQAEYRHRGSSYFLGATLHTRPDVRPTLWACAEQLLLPRLTLLAAYGHAFGNDILCNNFCGLGGKYAFRRVEPGLFVGYTRILDIDEWAAELVCNISLTSFLNVKPVLHIITADHTTSCIAMLRMEIGI